MYEFGRGVNSKFYEASEYYRKACNLGNPKACGALGRLALEGKGALTDSHNAREWLQKAADLNDPTALYLLGKRIMEGDTWSEEGSMKGRQMLTQSMRLGNALAAYELAAQEHYGIGLFKNCETATGLLKTVAEQGPLLQDLRDAYAAYKAGNIQEAALRYLILGDQGLQVAQFNAGFLLDKATTGVAAKAMLEQAAEQGDLDALVELGDLFYYGRGLAQNFSTALAYYKYAERMKHRQAQFNVAYMHHFGEGAPPDSKLAKRYYDDLLNFEESQASALLMLALLFLEEWAVVVVSCGVAIALGFLVK
jgi:SEL1 protein